MSGFERQQWESPAGQQELAKLHRVKKRVHCPCNTPTPEMYIAKVGEKYVVKRMPDTGNLHASQCDSYEPPPELSGLGEVAGQAIIEDDESGMTELRLGFSLLKVTGKELPTNVSEDDTVKSSGHRLSIRGTLHYLWETAGFTKWTPQMAGKRSWYVIRKFLLQAAGESIVKKHAFTDYLYVPEAFSLEKKNEIGQRRATFMHGFTCKSPTGNRKLGILVAEVKKFDESRFGKKMVLKNAPDFPFMIDLKMYDQIVKKWEIELDLWETYVDSHMIVIATFHVSVSGVPHIEEIALMPATSHWIPYETVHEMALIDDLVHKKRKFQKGLRYNLSTTKPLASAVLTDTSPTPTALYLQASEPEETFTKEMATLQRESKLGCWIWETGNYKIPDYPPAIGTFAEGTVIQGEQDGVEQAVSVEQ